MKALILGLATAGLLIQVANAQTTTTTPGAAGTTASGAQGDKAAASGNDNQAVATTSANANTPAKGANSFTSGEAQSRLEKNGFANISDLKKDDDGIWRGTAKKGDQTQKVWLDYKGNTGVSQ